MNHQARVLAISLLALLIFVSSSLSSVSSTSRPLPPTQIQQKDKEQTGGADAERVAGRRALRQGEAGKALIHLNNALNLYAQGGEKAGEAATHDLLGELYEQQGGFTVALEHFQSAYRIYTTPPGKPGDYNANLMLAKIGNMRYRQGDLVAARVAYMQMNVKKPDISAFSNTQIAAKTGSIVGGLLGGKRGEQIQKTAKAADALLTTKQMFDFYRQAIIYAGYETGLGRVDYRGAQFESAKKHFANALSTTTSALPLLKNLGQMRRFRIAARTSLGDVAFAQGNFTEAVKLYDDAAGEAQKEKRLDLMWPAQRGLGRSHWAQAAKETDAQKREQFRNEALKAYRAALKSIEEFRAGSVRADEARTTFLATTKDVFDEASNALAEMALMSALPDASRPLEGKALAYAAEAFQFVEQGRARSLLDLLGETGTNIREGVPPELFERKQENLDRQAEIARELLGVSLSSQPSKSVEALEKEADDLEDKYVAIENDIRNKSQQRYKALTSTQPLTLAQVRQEVLDEKTALLEYSLGSEASYLWVVTREFVRLFKLPKRAELEAQADGLRRQMLPPEERQSIARLTATDTPRSIKVRRRDALPAASAFAAASHKLYQSILEQAIGVVGTRRLLIVPDGALSFVPFEALVTAPDGADYAALPYLAKTNETIYAPSASVVAAVRGQISGNAVTDSTAILLIADPIFDTDDERMKNLAAGASTTSVARGLGLSSAIADVAEEQTDSGIPAGFRLPRILGTREEAEQIGQTAESAGLKAERWLDLDASEANVEERDLKPYHVLHFATHGLLNARRPQFTGMVLSLVGNKDGRDGFLRTSEVFNLRLSSPLVVLSACETGLGKETRGEGVMGLTRAFMYAGAPVVVVSLWSVNDKATADLMADFYKNLLAKNGAKPAAALFATRQNMIAGRQYSAPFYWAPFVLVGDWQ